MTRTSRQGRTGWATRNSTATKAPSATRPPATAIHGPGAANPADGAVWAPQVTAPQAHGQKQASSPVHGAPRTAGAASSGTRVPQQHQRRRPEGHVEKEHRPPEPRVAEQSRPPADTERSPPWWPPTRRRWPFPGVRGPCPRSAAPDFRGRARRRPGLENTRAAIIQNGSGANRTNTDPARNAAIPSM